MSFLEIIGLFTVASLAFAGVLFVIDCALTSWPWEWLTGKKQLDYKQWTADKVRKLQKDFPITNWETRTETTVLRRNKKGNVTSVKKATKRRKS